MKLYIQYLLGAAIYHSSLRLKELPPASPLRTDFPIFIKPCLSKRQIHVKYYLLVYYYKHNWGSYTSYQRKKNGFVTVV
jgi:hypothetical protein